MGVVSDRITPDAVAKVAKLARLVAQRRRAAAGDRTSSSDMLDHFADIDALDLDDVEPMTQPYPLANVLRDDVGGRASTATRCSPPRRRPRTAASACRRSSGWRR